MSSGTQMKCGERLVVKMASIDRFTELVNLRVKYKINICAVTGQFFELRSLLKHSKHYNEVLSLR